MRISDWSSDVCSSDLVRARLSSVSVTSAKSRAGRAVVPAKITSSIPPPRSDRALDSPIVQRIASSRLDLPQPLGPTTPVSPRSILSSVERSEEHTSELQSLMRISYAVFCLTKKKHKKK